MDLDPNQIQLTDEHLRILSELSLHTGKPPQELLSEALRRLEGAQTPHASFGPFQSFHDRLASKGLIGCLSGSPPDLSTNAVHMEGFGT
jgi:hypothetical protein